MTAPGPTSSFWSRRLVAPITTLLTQGVAPDQVAATLAVGTACSLFPFLGFTSLLNLGVGLRLRMNQPILQTLNQLLGPVQLVMIVVYVRLGEWGWRVEATPFSVTEMLRAFHVAGWGEFLQRFGWAGIHAFTAWVLSVPLILPLVYYPLRPVLRRLASARAGRT